VGVEVDAGSGVLVAGGTDVVAVGFGGGASVGVGVRKSGVLLATGTVGGVGVAVAG